MRVAVPSLLAAVAGIAFALLAVAGAQGPPDGPAYEMGGEIVARTHADGSIEFCFEAADGQRLCPESRFLDPATARAGRWLRSSEIEWRAVVDPDLVIIPPAPAPAPVDTACNPDLERMMAATWKVETARYSGTAFHIGDGRFLTAHHVIDGRPPFVALLHGDRVVPAMVLGSDPDVDVALLEAARPGDAADIPALAMRNPLPADVGSPVQLVGYPQGGPLTVSYGGLISRVWEDEIQTTASSAGGNSGGPMFDACGEVLGVLWAGSSASNFSHSSAAVQAALDRMTPRRPSLPSRVPASLQGEGRLIWHYGPEPPPMVDCSGHDGDRWVGVIEERVGTFGNRIGRLGVTVAYCSWRHAAVVGWTGDISAELNADGALCMPRSKLTYPDEGITELSAWRKKLGRFRFRAVTHPIFCPHEFNYSLLFDMAEPIDDHHEMQATLITADGRTLLGPSAGRSYRVVIDSSGSRAASIEQDWKVPPGFQPVAVQVTVSRRHGGLLLSETLPLDAESRVAAGPTLSVPLKIAVRVDADSGAVRACIDRPSEALDCPDRNLAASAPGDRSWRRTSPLSWLEDVPEDLVPESLAARPELALTACTIDPALPARAWQVTTVLGNGTAIYVGGRQFLAPAALISDAVPWAVISRQGDALPAARVAVDQRNGLALLELIDDARPSGLGEPILLRAIPDESEGSRAHLLAYPWGDARRYTVTVVEIDELTPRQLETEWLGWGRDGAALFDPCSGRLLGISLRSSAAIRAGVAAESLRDLRARRSPPASPPVAPPLHGPAAAYPNAVYYSPVQPDFGGWICNVRTSERYDVTYAVYLAAQDSFDAAVSVDGEEAYARTCGWRGKVFIVELRSDQQTDAVCIAPREPERFRTTVELELDAPPGFEIESAQEFERGACPGVREGRWESTHFVRVRSRGEVGPDKVSARLENAAGDRFYVSGWGGFDPDPDVAGWRFNVDSGEPVKLVIEPY